MEPEPTWQHVIHGTVKRRTVVLSGEIDVNGASDLQDLLQTTVSATPAVDVDLSAVQFIDSTVISALITAQRTALAAGRRLTVVNPTARVHRILNITGVLHALTNGEA